MEAEETYEMAAKADAFKSSLINIYLRLNGTEAIVDLIESEITDKRLGDTDVDMPPELKNILKESTLIVSSGRLTRLSFSNLRAILIQEEYVDIVDNIKLDLKRVPKLANGDTYPFMKVVNSAWRRLLPDYQGGDNPNMQHFKLVSMETCIDVIAYLDKIESGLSEADSDAGPTETLQF